MVFESIVVDVLNRFLGDYVENLNRSQLKLGIWGGDVVLENLILKQNALEELNIPVQTVYGHLGKLVLKIPWKNLYGASVEATIERLFLIVNPSAEVKYDPEKEEKMALASKQAELARVEEAKKKEAQKDENKLDETFVEKLVTQIIKNVQLKITDIHVRYEDSITNPKTPFSFGFTLHNLSVHTTDESWKKTVIQEAVTKIFKILNLEGLAVYWNPGTELYSKSEADEIKSRLQKEIATKSSKPSFYKYALGPINATAKLKLNPKPEGDLPKFSIPKVILTLHMEQLSVSLNKSQYQDMMLLADSMDRMSKGAPYRKYRPDLKRYRGHYKEWWRFAYKCVLEEDVRRRRRNWDWNHMMGHRQLCKDYANAYQNKISCKGKVASEYQCVIDKAEKNLDLFNLVVIRQRIEMEVERLGKLEEEAKKSRGWFSGWWGGGGSKDDELSEGVAIIKQFEKAMTSDEKEKLFRAIDYQENTAPLHLPTEYVAVESHFRLDKLQVSVNDVTEVLRACVEDVVVDMRQRPSANALRVDVQMRAFTVTGKLQDDFEPQLVTSKEVTKGVNLLNVLFETNPLDGSCDQRVKVQAQPLQIIYDAQTVIEIVNVFKPPTESTALTTLQAAAENKFSDLKEKSTLSMQYAVHQHTFIDLDIDIGASFIIIPQTGIYKGSESCLVVKLGAISVRSEERARALDVRDLHRRGLQRDSLIDEIARHSYDRVALRLTQMQIVVVTADEDWYSAIASKEATPMHLLQPTNLVIQIHKCLITDDPRLPKFKIMGELEKIAISVSEDRLLTLCEIIVSMPLPQSEETTQLKASDSKASSLSLLKYLDPVEKQKRDSARSKQRKSDEQSVQLTEVEAFFIMKELIVSVNRNIRKATQDYEKFLVFSLNLLELTATQKTFTLEANVRLGSVNMQHHRMGKNIINMIETPELQSNVELTEKNVANQYLFTVTYSNVDKKCPEFRSHYGSVEQMIVLDFTTLTILLHLQGLQEILVIVNEYQTRLQTIQSSVDRYANAGPLETIAEDEEFSVAKSKSNVYNAAISTVPGLFGLSDIFFCNMGMRPNNPGTVVSVSKPSKHKQVESIQLKVDVNIRAVEISFETDRRPLSTVKLQGAAAGLILKSSYTQVDCTIASIKVEDLNPLTIHKEILKVLGGDVINVQIVMYNIDQYSSVNDVNMSIDAQVNCLRIIFLNWFVSSMLDFLNNFQAAQAAIIEASSQAADAARANVATAYQNSTKLRLRVRLAAPLLVLPEHSTSRRALLVDLGRMTINNKFIDLAVPDETNKVIVDELLLELEDMKVSCVFLNEDGGQDNVQERKLLRPTSVKLLVKRSLSSWYQTLPDLDVSGRMNTIAITVGHSDYKSIMNILNQNLQEGQRAEDVKSLATETKVASKSTVNRQNSASKGPAKASQQVLTPTPSKMPRTTIKFSFTMDSFVIDLMNTIGSEDSLFAKDVELARFCLALLSVKGRMFSDGSMNTSVLLVDCTLDDTRPGRGAKITRYLERRSDKKDTRINNTDEVLVPIMETHNKIRSMIDVTYTLKNGDTFIDMRIFSFNLILAMDFLNKIAEFMTTGLGESSDTKDTSDPKTTKSQTEKSVENIPKKKVSVSSAPSTEAKKLSMMTVNIKIEQPDIILVESLEQKECDALVLNMEVRMKLRRTEERMVCEGGVSGLQLVRRRLGGSAPPRSLLAPTHLSLALSQPPGQGVRVDVALTDIKITVSPELIALLNRVLATVTRREEDNVVEENKPTFYVNLWNVKPFRPNEYWFLKTEEAQEAIDTEVINQEVKKPPVGEICLLSSPSIVVALEMEIGNETIPVLVMQASLSGQMKDWSSDLYIESTWAMQVSYYNISRAVWEPLIEPVEILKDYQYKHVPWELKMEVVMRPQETLSIETTEEANLQALAEYKPSKTVTISSSETLEITISRSGMEVLTQLGNSFSAAVGDVDTSIAIKSKTDPKNAHTKFLGAPYVLHNCTGLTAKLTLQNNDDFLVFLTEEYKVSDYREVVLEPGASLPLQLKHGGLNVMKLNEPPPPLKLNVKIVEMDDDIQIPVERADKRYFSIGQRRSVDARAKNVPHVAAVEPRGLISDIVMHDAALHIYLRSIVQVTNTLSVSVSVYYMTLSGNEVRLLGEVCPGDTLRLPLQAVHTPTAEIFFSVEGFTVSVSPFVWRELQQEVKLSKLLQCDSKDKNSGEKFYLRAVGTMEQVFFEHSTRHTFSSSCYDVVLKPAVKLQNCLPVSVSVSQLGLRRTQPFRAGEMFHLSHLAPNRASIVVTIENYLDKCWVCTKNLPDEESELSVWSFESHDSPSVMTLELGVHNVNLEGTQVLSLYCPFWMLNKTGFTLCYRNVDETGNVIFHPKNYKEPILFSFRAKNFFGKKKAAIRVEFGEWSDKFSLDVPGSSGVVICKNEGRTYQVAVTNQLTFNSLTKMVIFTPFFLIINECPFPIEYQELHRAGDPWREVDQNSSAPLWPVVEKEDKLLLVRVSGSSEHAAPFLYTEQNSVCLKLNNQYGGLHVEVQLSEGGTYVTVRQYRDGHAPALLVNYSPHTLLLYEKENVNTRYTISYTHSQYRDGHAPALLVNYSPHTLLLYEKENVNTRYTISYTHSQYRDGHAPALLVNYSPHTLLLYEKENVNTRYTISYTHSQYRDGHAPALLVNYSPHTLLLYEKENVNTRYTISYTHSQYRDGHAPALLVNYSPHTLLLFEKENVNTRYTISYTHSQYRDGHAPALLVNYSPHTLLLYEKENVNTRYTISYTHRQYRDGHAPALLVNYSPHTLLLYEKENVNTRYTISYTHRQYRDGHAPALLVNYSPHTLLLYEKENVNTRYTISYTHRQYRDGHAPALLVNYSPHTLLLYEKENVNTRYTISYTHRQYRDGHAPALLVNYSPHTLLLYEKENVNTRNLPSMNQMLYTWDNPAGPRILIFEGHKRKEIENDLRRDGIGDFMINETHRIWWVSFLDGLQRVVLFTEDGELARGAHTIGEAEHVHTEILLAMHGLGLSLVNDPELTEILYVSISNSGIIWEQCKIGSRRYKKIEGPKAILLEEAYQKYSMEKQAGGNDVPPIVKIDEKTEVDFSEMRQLRPQSRVLRRMQEPGAWASYGLSAHSRRLRARLHRLQVDQQLPLPTFPVLLAPVPPPRSVANDDPAGTKPFIEIAIVERIMEHSKVRQYKYYKMLIQEFHVKVDMGIINALMGMFPQKLLTEQEALDAFQLDIEKAGQPLEALAAIGAASDLKNFYDNLHLSPLKVHVSFSLGGATQLPTFVGTVLQSIGVTLTDMNDVVFKLSYYERNFEFLSQKELISQVQNHYTGQALKQLYVLVLGLDVIGNPYGLVIGLKKGVEDLFYEPFQGAIQGPGEFAEGLMLGVRSLVGHTVGGAAGAVSRITGAMGHGLAALSLDKDYQRRRRDNINKPPANLQEGLARSGKGLFMGVVDGVTGLVTKPYEGARDQGVEGFFKGLGVGAVGLVARPTAGVVDFASGSFDAVKRAADLSEEVTKRRAARYLAADAGVRPYSRLQAEGYKMLFELEKGKFVSMDTYEAHVWVIPAKEVVMCTDKRLLYLEKNNVFGGWQIVWTYLWSEIPEVPTPVPKGVYIPTAKKKVLGMFPSSGSGKVIFLYDEQQKKYLLAQCERLMRSR